MTETSSLFATNPVSNPYPVTSIAASVSPLLNGAASPANAPVDEEQYTIKCICIYTDDDGSTVYCEKCDTWQHISCYYPGKGGVPEIHFCADCDPRAARDIDPKKATERQKRRREELEGGDRKVKRPASKGQKKKHRDTIGSETVNGWTNHDRNDSIGNGRDQPPPAKKPKTSHRASNSVASVNGESRKRAYSNVQMYPSPSKSPPEQPRFTNIPRYTSEFLELYDRDEGDTNAKDNEQTISAVGLVSAWKTNPSLMVSGSNVPPTDRSPFVRLDGDLDEQKLPQVSVEVIQPTDFEFDGTSPTWKSLRLQSDVEKGALIGEVRGQIGTLDEYCHQQVCQNRWKDLSHPDPFVFFHPHMNIYIDSRRSGTIFRYIRRSCDPNVTLRTFVTADGEAHHCFVASKDISAGSELTTTWYLNQNLFGINLNREEDQLLNERCEFISKVLANFGDCACGQTKCKLGHLDRRSSIKSADAATKALGQKKRKMKTKHAISPLSTGQATNSRAGSETVKAQDDDDDRRSTSESSRSGPHSRDLTPTQGGLLDADPVLGNGLTAREMRKIQALEKATKDHVAKVEKKQKKRSSGGSTMNTPNVGSSKQLTFSSVESKTYSGSPPPMRALKDVSNRLPSIANRSPKAGRPNYTSISIQTDPEVSEYSMPPAKRRKFKTPTQRLLNRLLQDRALCKDSACKRSVSDQGSMTVSREVEMTDAQTSLGFAKSTMGNRNSPVLQSPPLPLPSQAAHTLKVHEDLRIHNRTLNAPRLSLSTLPPVPAFPTATSATPNSSSATPGLITPSMSQSPGGLGLSLSAVVTPSPAKKKLSLGDYMSRRKESATPSSEKTQAQSMNHDGELNKTPEQIKTAQLDTRTESQSSLPRPNDSVIQEAALKSETSEHAVDDTPMKEEADTEHQPSIPKQRSDSDVVPQRESTLSPSNSRNVAPEVANVLASLQQIYPRQEAGKT